MLFHNGHFLFVEWPFLFKNLNRRSDFPDVVKHGGRGHNRSVHMIKAQQAAQELTQARDRNGMGDRLLAAKIDGVHQHTRLSLIHI